MEFCKGVGPFEEEEPATVVNVPSFDPNPPRRLEAQQPQEPVQVWPSG